MGDDGITHILQPVQGRGTAIDGGQFDTDARLLQFLQWMSDLGQVEAGGDPGRALHRVAGNDEKDRFEFISLFVHGLGLLVETKKRGAFITMPAPQ
ncbi:hypothetical protein D3C72_2363040 [compost metagenome]